MPSRSKSIDQSTTAADRATLRALLNLVEYQPSNSAFATALIQQLEASLAQAEQAEERLVQALDEARNVRWATAQALHDIIVGARIQVLAQFGSDSMAVKAVGLTRKSDRRRPTRKAAKAQ